MNYPSETIKAISEFIFIDKPIDKLTKYDLVIVLGNDIISKTVEGLFRVWQNGNISVNAKIILSGNVGVRNAGCNPEAEDMYNEAIKKGMPKELFIIENKATNTHENFKNIKEIIGDIGKYNKILCITQSFLTRRALMTASALEYPTDKFDFYGVFDEEGRNISKNAWWLTQEGRNRIYAEFERIGTYSKKGDITIF